MSSTIFSNSGTEVKTLKDQLSLNDTAKIRTGTDDPRSVAKEGAQGSIYLQTGSSGGKVFKKLDSGTSTNWSEVGSGAGGINYITNPDAEAGTTGWAAYADAAGSIPVDGTGGAPTVTITTSASSPLRGLNSFLLTKDAANRQGEGVSAVFTIDAADKAEVMAIEIDYSVSSGTFVAGTASDVQVFVYDVTNAVLIQPVATTLQSNTQSKYKGLFQTSSNSTSYRLILHCATTSAAAYVLKFDNVRVGPQAVLFGAPVTDWSSFTPAWTGSVSDPAIGNGTLSGMWRRIGDSIEIRGYILWGTTTTNGSGAYIFGFPTGVVMDTAKLIGATGQNNTLGIGTYHNNGVAVSPTTAEFSSTTGVSFNLLTNSATISTQGLLGSASGGSNTDEFFWNIKFPVVGWSSQVQMSDSSDTRVVSARARGATASVTSGNIIIHGTEDFDTHGAYDPSTGRFTCPVGGFYRVESFLVDANASHTLTVYKNASTDLNILFVDTASGRGSGSITLSCNAGDILDIRPNATTGAIDPQSWVTFTRVSGPSAIAANELVAVKARRTTAHTVATATATTVIFSTEDIDTHGAYDNSTGLFTAPVSGTYCVQTTVGYVAPAITYTYLLFVEKNSASSGVLIAHSTPVTTPNPFYASIGGLISLVAGDVVRIRTQHSDSGNLDTDVAQLGGISLSIHRVGF